MRIGGIIRYLQPAGSSALIAALRDSRTLSTVNDGDGLLEPGETIEMTVTLVNITNDTTVSDVVGILDTDEIDVDIDRNYDEINYGTMSYSGSSKRRTGVYRFTIDDRIEVDSIPFRLDISGRISNAVQNLGTDEFIIPISR